jgi:hypothetical protein
VFDFGIHFHFRFEAVVINVFHRMTAHDWETDHPRAVFIDPNDLS